MSRFALIFAFIYFIIKPTSGLQCKKISRCKCEMSDGSGTVSLAGVHPTSDSPKYSYSTHYWNYDYNPCLGFSSHGYADLAIIQKHETGYGKIEYFQLGLQSTERFNMSRGNLYVRYDTIGYDHHGSRISKVVLKCNRTLQRHEFKFVRESHVREYDFVLEGPCACPGGCNAHGIIRSNSTANWTVEEREATTYETTRYTPTTSSYYRRRTRYFRERTPNYARRTRPYYYGTTPYIYRRNRYERSTTRNYANKKINRNDERSDGRGSNLKWETVGYDLVSLLLHDLILVAFIITFVLVVIYFFGYKQSCLTKNVGRNYDDHPSYSVNT